MAFVDAIGRGTVDSLAYVGQFASLIARAAKAVGVSPRQGHSQGYRRAIHQAMAVGVGAIPILSLITFFVGTILALQAAYELRRFGALEFIASAVAISITRELGPLMTAILVIGRSGSALTRQL